MALRGQYQRHLINLGDLSAWEDAQQGAPDRPNRAYHAQVAAGRFRHLPEGQIAFLHGYYAVYRRWLQGQRSR